MPTTIYNIQVLITSPDGTSYAASQVSMSYAINDIPVAAITIIPRTEAEVQSLSGIEANLFKEYIVTAKINSSEYVLFKGYFVGAQTMSSPSATSLTMQLYGGLYKLSQTASLSLGLNVICPSSPDRVAHNADSMKARYMNYETYANGKTNILDIFKLIAKNLLEAVTRTMEEHTFITKGGTIPGSGYGALADAIAELYKLNSEKNIEILDSELGKIVASEYLNASAFKSYDSAHISNSVSNLITHPEASFWDVIILLCEQYMIAIGTMGDTTYAIPFSPVPEPSITLDPSRIKTIMISPMPVKIPTRCYFSSNSQFGGNGDGTPQGGSYPSGADMSKPTSLEIKLGTIRPIVYNEPGFTIFRETEPNSAEKSIKKDDPNTSESSKKSTLEYNQEEDNKFAHGYLIKESFKQRNGSLFLAFSPDIPVGSIVAFTDPFYKRTYQGYVAQVSHSFSTTMASTELSLQYVIGDNESTFLGLKDSGFTDNPLYPGYKSSSIVDLLGLKEIPKTIIN